MSEKHPEDEEVIPADIVGDVDEPEEVVEAQLVEPPPVAPAYGGYRSSGRSAALRLWFFLGGLVLVLVLSILFRGRLTDAYDALVTRIFGVASDGGPSGERASRSETETTPAKVTSAEGETPAGQTPTGAYEVEVPAFKKREEPTVHVKEPKTLPHKKKPPGYGYSRVEIGDLSSAGVSKYQIKVVIPAHYGKDDFLRVAADVIRRQRRLKECHAVRVLFFPDTDRVAPEDTLGVVVWAPGGDFRKAARAVRLGSDRNTYRVRVLK